MKQNPLYESKCIYGELFLKNDENIFSTPLFTCGELSSIYITEYNAMSHGQQSTVSTTQEVPSRTSPCVHFKEVCP